MQSLWDHLSISIFPRYYAYADYFLQIVIFRSRDGFLANENKRKNHRMMTMFKFSYWYWSCLFYSIIIVPKQDMEDLSVL